MTAIQEHFRTVNIENISDIHRKAAIAEMATRIAAGYASKDDADSVSAIESNSVMIAERILKRVEKSKKED
tara:strand:+ start:2367 stop:2579 length:213 start_codon:yes stop_codon:yes gene_type:complete